MNLQAIFQEAITLHQAGRLGEAERLYAQLLQQQPKNFAVLHLMGVLRQQQGAHPEAHLLFERALAVNPAESETLIHAGVSLYAMGRLDEALARIDRGIALAPNHAKAHYNRGVILTAMRRLEEAVHACDRATALDPNYMEASNQGGVALRDLRRNEEALHRFDAVVARAPNHAGAWNNRGSTLWDMGLIAEARASFDRAIALWPDFIEALVNRGNMRWGREKDLAGAIADLETVKRLRPDYPYLLGDLMHLKNYAGDWLDYDRRKAELDAAVRGHSKATVPFIYLAISDEPADLAAAARIYAADKYPAAAPLWTPARKRKDGRIRIGYVSGEFRPQATSYLMAGIYDHHDKSRFEIIAFDNGRDDGSPLRVRMAAAFDKMIPIAGLSAREAAQRVLDEEIDILVNLNGYYGALRMDLFAHRPAPVQVNYLGFPGTLGADYIDYLIADRTVIPEQDRRFYAEQVVWLPGSYQANDSRRAIGTPTSRAEAGLPQDAFVFCHFNYSFKLTPDTFASWMRILTRTPGSVLWLLETDALFAQNVRGAAAAAGVDGSRIIWAPQLEQSEHLARLTLGDLFLDSLPCNAHTTASDALWAGLPLLTRPGHVFSGRVAASLLRAIGLDDLIVESEADYENLAVALAGDAARMAALRATLAQNRATWPLYDTARYTKNLEAAYQDMFERRQRGEAPAAFAVPDEMGGHRG